MNAERILIIALGAIAMLAVMLIRSKSYPNIAKWKYFFLCLWLTISGVIGTLLLFYIENGYFRGTSFFGAILFVPILMLPALLMKIPYGTLMDITAVSECAMLAVMKLDCIESGCCGGKYLFSHNNIDFYFPSQIIEMITVILIMFALIRLDKEESNKTKLFPFYMIFYGATRSLLNWFRANQSVFLLELSPGTFWGIVSILIGCMWLLVIRIKNRKN